MKKIGLLILWCGYCGTVFAVSMNFHGSFRSEGDLYSRLGLGQANMPSTKTFLSARALLNPNLVIDDHFSLRSQWSLLTSPTLTPNATDPLGAGQGGYVLGDVQTNALVLNQAWLEWTSDFGVLRAGRMPVAWGYGLIWDAGTRVWDDFQTTLDRLEYQLHLGNVVGGVAYSKGRKISVLGAVNDQDFYTIYLKYHNPELDVEGGIQYEKQERTSSQARDFASANASALPSPNPYKAPGDPYPLSAKMPYPMSNNIVDAYLKKTVGYFTFGGEIAWLTGKAWDYNGNGIPDSLNAIGGLLSTSYEYHKIKAFMEILYAGGDSNLNADHLSGFVLLHRNRRPGLILGHELLGPYMGNNVGLGSLVVYGNADTFSGVIYVRPGFKFDWSRSWSSGIEFVIARKAVAAPGDNHNLGGEVDVGTEYQVYQDFDLGLTLGYLVAGTGLRVANPRGPFAIRFTSSLKF